MRLKDFWATLGRRWYLSVAALAIALVGVFLVVVKVGPTYEAEGSVLVFPPVVTVQRSATELETQGNPYLVLNGVGQARDIVLRALISKPIQDELANEVPDSTFEATPDFTNSAPIILITAKASSSADATAALAAAMERVPRILVDLQSGLDLPSGTEITSRPLVVGGEPDPVYSGQIRAGLVAGVVALGLGLLIVGLLDGLLTGRAARKDNERPASFGGDSHSGAVPGRGLESPARSQERSRRMSPRAPVRPQVDRIAASDDQRDAAGLSEGRLQSGSIRMNESAAAVRAAKV